MNIHPITGNYPPVPRRCRHAVILIGELRHEAYVTLATSALAERVRLSLAWLSVIRTDQPWPKESAISAMKKSAIGTILKECKRLLGNRAKELATGYENSYSRPTAVSVRAPSVQKPIKRFSRLSMSNGTAASTEKQSVVTRMPIFGGEVGRGRVIPCSAGIAMQVADLRAYARTWKAE